MKKTKLYYEVQKRGWSDEEFASKVYSTARSVNNWFNQDSVPFRPTKVRIAEVLGIELKNVDSLFNLQK